MLHRDRPGASVAFLALDSLRAVAAVAVLAHPRRLLGREPMRTTVYGTALIASIDVGVAVFFVLSGFLLYRPFSPAANLAGTPRPSVCAATSSARFLRIFPAYGVAPLVALPVRLPDYAALATPAPGAPAPSPTFHTHALVPAPTNASSASPRLGACASSSPSTCDALPRAGVYVGGAAAWRVPTTGCWSRF